MADKTSIEWTDATWQIVTGCSVVSPGCTNCYAMKLAGTRLRNHPSRADLTVQSKAGPVWNGKVRFNVGWLLQPLEWTKPRDVFVAAHGDLFHDAVQRWMLVKVFAVMAIAQRHRFQVLTKRAANMRAFLTWLMTDEGRAALEEAAREIGHTFEFEGKSLLHLPLANVWCGVSVEDQPRADERIPLLLQTPAAVRWISGEPLLGALDIRNYLYGNEEHGVDLSREVGSVAGGCVGWTPPLDWIVIGGESGPAARPAHPDWFRSLRDQCLAADVPFFFKQNGAWVSVSEVEGAGPHHKFPDGATVRRVGKKIAGATLDGREWREMPT